MVGIVFRDMALALLLAASLSLSACGGDVAQTDAGTQAAPVQVTPVVPSVQTLVTGTPPVQTPSTGNPPIQPPVTVTPPVQPSVTVTPLVQPPATVFPPVQPPVTVTPITTVALCPATVNIANSTFMGGTNAGEVISLNIDAVAMTYRLKWLESPIALRTGSVMPTRAGTQIMGSVTHPIAGTLPTVEQTRCTFVLDAGTGVAVGDGQPYTTAVSLNNPNPATVFLGQGVASGALPGASIRFGGVLGLGIIDSRQFDFFPFFAFATTTTNITLLAGTYNDLIYHTAPTAKYAATTTSAVETFDTRGNCTSGGCLSAGNPLTSNSNGYFDSTNPPQIVSGSAPGLLRTGDFGISHFIIGLVNGMIVPLAIRTGSTNVGTLAVDDESGIAILTAATSLPSGGINGNFVGADSNFKFVNTAIQYFTGTFENISTLPAGSGFILNYAALNTGLIAVHDANSNPGVAVASPGVYAIEIQGAENGGVAPTSGNSSTSDSPYFAIGFGLSK